jgi:alpha-glucosidase
MRTDSLTLLVNPDAEGNASGRLYEDSGDGFEYRHGQYAQYEIKAQTAGKKISVNLTKTGGKMQEKNRLLRVGIVADGKITYSSWTAGNQVTTKVVADKQQGIDKGKLTFPQVPEK